jgi:FHS family L-fucose permease-like MFS transporter
MSIAGGAVMTPLMGLVADHFGMRIGFLIPLLCFAFVALYGGLWRTLKARDAKLPLSAMPQPSH